MTNQQNIKQAQEDIANDVAFLKEIIESDYVDFSDKLKAANILQDLVNESIKAIVIFKTEVRTLAEKSGDSKFQALSDCGDICASVVTPKKSFKLSSFFNVAEAIQLPEFDNLVEEKTTYKLKRGAAETILSMTGESRDQWMQMLQQSDPTPRVFIKDLK